MQPLTRLVLASHNPKKTAELRAILEPLGITLLSLADFPGAPEPEENGATLEENAVIKAESALRHTNLPCLADDTGLEVAALGGLPGVRSARFAGENASDAMNNALLLEKLAGVPEERRGARFVTVIALARRNHPPLTFRGEAAGHILESPRGEGGFGYDPLFRSDEMSLTFAELPSEAKNSISHRGKALGELAKWLAGAAEG